MKAVQDSAFLEGPGAAYIDCAILDNDIRITIILSGPK